MSDLQCRNHQHRVRSFFALLDKVVTEEADMFRRRLKVMRRQRDRECRHTRVQLRAHQAIYDGLCDKIMPVYPTIHDQRGTDYGIEFAAPAQLLRQQGHLKSTRHIEEGDLCRRIASGKTAIHIKRLAKAYIPFYRGMRMRTAFVLACMLLFASCIEPPLPPKEPLPSPWRSADVGDVGILGSATYTDGTFTLTASGFDIMREADEHHYAYQNWQGDLDIIARIDGIENTRTWLKSGVVIRESLEPGSRMAGMLSAYDRGMLFVTREEPDTHGPLKREENRQVSWVRIIRTHNQFHGYISDDGNHWTHIETREIDMPETIHVGLALASHDNTELATAHFTHTTIQDAPDTLPQDPPDPQPDPPSQEYYTHGASAPPHPIPTGPRHYISPHGSDTNPGTQSEPWQTFEHALAYLEPGSTLILQDGTYTRTNTGMLHINNLHGTSTQRITIMAENERQARIESEGYTSPIQVRDSTHLTIIGITAIHGDRSTDDGARSPHDIIQVRSSEHIKLKRMLAAYTNRYFNAHGIAVIDSQNVLVEESEVYHHHRHGIMGWQSRYLTFRRSYANSMNYETLPDGRHTGNPSGGDEGLSFYGSSSSIMENSIAENNNAGFQIHTASASDIGGNFAGGRHNRVLGCITIDTTQGQLVSNRISSGSGIMHRSEDNVFENCLSIGTRVYAMRTGHSRGTIHRSVTIYDTQNVIAQLIDLQDCTTLDKGCDWTVQNSLIWNNARRNIAMASRGYDHPFLVEYSNLYDNGGYTGSTYNGEDITNNAGRYRNNIHIEPTGSTLGSGPGQTLVYIPEDSNMKGAGKGGADIGANILYRYQNGELTTDRLWHPSTGAFPHGAIVEGINDHERSLSTLHTRLGVSQETLPHNY